MFVQSIMTGKSILKLQQENRMRLTSRKTTEYDIVR